MQAEEGKGIAVLNNLRESLLSLDPLQYKRRTVRAMQHSARAEFCKVGRVNSIFVDFSYQPLERRAVF